MALTLNDTTADDNLAVFLMEMKVEGNNQVGNSGFNSSSSTGWTTNNNWLIQNNQLEYTYVDEPGNASTQYTIAATTNGAVYVLEYEVIAISATTFTFECEGDQGANIITGDLTLPQTLGKHSVRIVADGGTVLGFKLGDGAAGDSIFLDDIKIRKEVDVIRIATRGITMSGNVFDGISIQYNQISNLDAYIDAESSGGLGAITGYSFKLKRHSTNSRVADFFNEYFPAYSGGQVVAREILFGVVWDTGTPAYADITWLMRGKVIDYSYEPRAINLIVLQSTEIEAIKEAPYYSIQKDFNNFISYFPNAPEENYGRALPIVYGDFSTYNDAQSLFEPRLFPIMCVEKHKLTYLAGSHEFETENMSSGGASVMYQYLDDLDTYMTLVCANGSSTNNSLGLIATHYDTLNSSDNVIVGTVNIRPTLPGSVNNVSDYANAIDGDTSTVVTIVNGGAYRDTKLSLKIKGGGSPPGTLSRSANSVILNFAINREDPVDAGVTVDATYYNIEFDSGAGGYGNDHGFTWTTGVEFKQADISSEFSARSSLIDAPWRWDELMGLECVLFPVWDGATSFTIDISSIWLRITNIIVNDPRLSRPRPSDPTGTRDRLRNRGRGGRG